jgi:hypothetical protein
VVELLLTLLALYGLQCVTLLPRGATLFLRPGSRWNASEGPGWRWLNPWPSGKAWVASRPALVGDAESLRTRGPTPWLGADYAETEGVAFVPGGGQAVGLRGQQVLVDGAPALRAPTRREAARLAAQLEALAKPGADADALLGSWRADAFAAGPLRERHERVDSATRWLGRLSDLGVVLLGAGLPSLSAVVGGERALVWLGPTYALLHLVLLLLLSRAQRAVHPGEGSFELLFAAALYPPLLLRSAGELVREALCGFHPAAVAAEVLPRDEALDLLRGELARPLPDDERAAVVAVVHRLGCSLDELFAAPERSDPLARAYCPACRTEYRRGEGACVDCGAPLEGFADEAAPQAEASPGAPA